MFWNFFNASGATVLINCCNCSGVLNSCKNNCLISFKETLVLNTPNLPNSLSLLAVSIVGLFEKIALTKPSSPKTSLKNSSLLLKVKGEKLPLAAEKAPPLIKFLAWVNAE